MWNAASGIIWGVGVTLLGLFAGTSYRRVEQALGRGSAVLLAVVVIAALILWHRRRRTRGRQSFRS